MSIKKKLIIIGAGGHAKETACVAIDANFNVIGYLDEDPLKHHQKIGDFFCLGGFDLIKKFYDCEFIIAVGNPRIRKNIYQRILINHSINFATIIHPSVITLGKNIIIGAGSALFPYACLTENITVGNHVILNVKTSISHDCIVKNFVTFNPSSTVCGTCVISDGVEIGSGATIIQNMSIGAGSFVGAGATVVSSLKENKLYIGTPAKLSKELERFNV